MLGYIKKPKTTKQKTTNKQKPKQKNNKCLKPNYAKLSNPDKHKSKKHKQTKQTKHTNNKTLTVKLCYCRCKPNFLLISHINSLHYMFKISI